MHYTLVYIEYFINRWWSLSAAPLWAGYIECVDLEHLLFRVGQWNTCISARHDNSGVFFRHHPVVAKFMGPTWGPPGSCRPPCGPHVGPMKRVVAKRSARWPSLWVAKCFSGDLGVLVSKPHITLSNSLIISIYRNHIGQQHYMLILTHPWHWLSLTC